MRTWAKELEAYTHHYVRRGGKQNRRKQVSLIVKFLEFTDARENLTSLHRLGKRHVIEFWQAHRQMPEKSAYDYWLGLCQLWTWLGKPEKPPRPHRITEPQTLDPPPKTRAQTTSHVYTELGAAIKAARERHHWTLAQLANRSGCEIIDLERLETGAPSCSLSCSDIQRLLTILAIGLHLEAV